VAIQLLSQELIREVTERAAASPRRRMNHNFHESATDNPHRFLNVFLKGSYVAPHRHLHPPKPEAFLVLQGRAVAVIFNDEGVIRERYVIGEGCGSVGIDLPAGVWHTIAALTPVAVCYEVKPGPWNPANDKEFAPWAPLEGDPRADGYLAGLTAGL
jgi:cupin fold WbuC family metalloprotein